MMRITYDPQVDVLYIELRDVDHDRGQQITAGTVLNYDSNGEVVAIEILDASKHVDGEPLTVALELLAPAPVTACS
ncbi:MAG TPA: DUF2283 domain-containing protein [Chloroflexota bacterium]|jgi:uncharacterized protein YuzE